MRFAALVAMGPRIPLGDGSIDPPNFGNNNAMKILSLETSGRTASVALLESDPCRDTTTVIQELTLSSGRRTARELAPSIRDSLDAAGWAPKSVGLVAVTVGPGSFTGLRVGVTTAKTFAYAVRAEAIGICTLRAVAAQVPHVPNDEPIEKADREIVAVISAERGQFAVERFRRGADGRLETAGDVRLLDAGEWIAGVRRGDIVTGPGLEKLEPPQRNRLPTADPSIWTPLASTVGAEAWRDFLEGRRENVLSLAPKYHRRSAAEEKRDAAAQPEPN